MGTVTNLISDNIFEEYTINYTHLPLVGEEKNTAMNIFQMSLISIFKNINVL